MHFLIVGQMQMDIPALCQSKDHRRECGILQNPTKVETYGHVQKKRTLCDLPNKSWDQILCSPPFGRIHTLPCEDLRKLPVGWDVPRQSSEDSRRPKPCGGWVKAYAATDAISPFEQKLFDMFLKMLDDDLASGRSCSLLTI